MGIDLIADIQPKNAGAFPTHSDVYGKGGFQVRADLTDRNSIPSLNRKIGMLVYVVSNGTTYQLIGGILDANWVVAGTGVLSVATWAALSAAPVPSSDGAIAYVQSVRRLYRYTSVGSALTVDSKRIFATSAAGATRWVQLTDTGDLVWAAQAAWVIDAQNVSGLASDENTGATSSVPLLTYAEYARRIRGLDVAVTQTITFLSTPATPANDPINLSGARLVSGANRIYQGPTPTTQRTGTLTISQSRNRATNAPWRVGDGGSGWGTTGGMRIRMTAGLDVGSYAWIDAAGDSTVTTSEWCTVTSVGNADTVTRSAPTANTYVAETLGAVCLGDVDVHTDRPDSSEVHFHDLHISSAIDDAVNLVRSGLIFTFIGCNVSPTWVVSRVNNHIGFLNCSLENGLYVEAGSAIVYAGLISGNALHCESGSTVSLDYDAMLGAGSGGVTIHSGGTCMVGAAVSRGAGLTDPNHNRTGAGVYVRAGGTLITDVMAGGVEALWGSGSLGGGVDIEAHGHVAYNAAIPTVTGTTGDFSIAGQSTARGWDAANGTYGPPRATTWANLAATIDANGLGGSAHSVAGRAGIAPFSIADAGGVGLTNVFNVRVFGARGDCVAHSPSSGTDDHDAILNAIAAAAQVTFPIAQTRPSIVYFPPLPYDRSYRIGTTATPKNIDLEVNVTLQGAPGAFMTNIQPVYPQKREGTQLTFCGGSRGIFVHNNTTSPNGGDATGATIQGLAIYCNSVSTQAYALNHTYAVNDLVKPGNTNTMVLKVLSVTGPTNNVAEHNWLSDDGVSRGCHVPNNRRVWTPGMVVRYGNAVYSSDLSQSLVEFQVSVPATPAAGPMTEGVTEPTWNYTLGAVTISSAGVHYIATQNNSTDIDGGTIFENQLYSAIYCNAPCVIRDVATHNAQNVGLCIFGSASFIIGNPTNSGMVDGLWFDGCGTGVYTRGGDLRAWTFRNVCGAGTAPSPQGTTAFPGGGDKNEHGIMDTSQSGCTWLHCAVQLCGGYDYWGHGASSQAKFLECFSLGGGLGGRVRLDSASSWWGPFVEIWNASGLGFAGTATSWTPLRGFNNAFEFSADLNYLTKMIDGVVAHPFSFVGTNSDGGVIGWRYSGGDWTLSWGGVSSGAIAISDRQVDKELTGRLRMPRGFATGNSTDYVFEFPDEATFRTPFRGGLRKVGDSYKLSSACAVGGWERKVVVTQGYTGPTRITGTFYSQYVAAPGAAAHPADVVTPSDLTNLNAFQCTTAGTTSGAEPTWTTAPAIGNTITDGTVVWTNVGLQPVLANLSNIQNTTQWEVTQRQTLWDTGVSSQDASTLLPNVRGQRDSVTTTNNTTATAASRTLAASALTEVNCTVRAFPASQADAATFALRGSWYRAGTAAPTQVEAPVVVRSTPNTTGVAWTAVLSLSGNDVRVRVTGDTGKTIAWTVTWEDDDATH